MKIITVLALVVMLLLATSAGVGARENDEIAGGYWKVTAAWHCCSPEGIAGKMIAITDHLESRYGMKFFYPAGAEGWDRVKKIRAGDLVWLAMTVDHKVRIDLNRQPPASMELRPDILK